MRFWAAAALLCFGVTLPACAQRGGGAHGGGFSGRGPSSGFGGGFHGGFSGPGRSVSSRGASQFGPRSSSPQFSRFADAGSRQRFAFNRPRTPYSPFAGGPTANRPTFFTRGSYAQGSAGVHASANRGGDGSSRNGLLRNHYPGYGYRTPGYFPGLLGYGFPFWDDGFDSFWGDPTVGDPDTVGYGNTSPQDGAPVPYAAPSAGAGDGAQPMESASPLPPYPYQVGASAPFALQGPAPAPPQQEDAVTLIFKDGRPSEQIRNYALTRTALYLPGKHMREIPLEQLDLPATERVNREAGVDFQIP